MIETCFQNVPPPNPDGVGPSWHDIVRIKAPFLRHILHVWRSLLPHPTMVADHWVGTRFWYDGTVGIMRIIPSNNKDGAGVHPSLRPADLLQKGPDFRLPFVSPKIPPGRQVRHSLRLKNDDPQSTTPRDRAGRRYGHGSAGGGRGGRGAGRPEHGGPPPDRLERVTEQVDADEQAMDSREWGGGGGRAQGVEETEKTARDAVPDPPQPLEVQLATLQREKAALEARMQAILRTHPAPA